MDLNGHEAGNGGHSQGKPKASRVLLYSERWRFFTNLRGNFLSGGAPIASAGRPYIHIEGCASSGRAATGARPADHMSGCRIRSSKSEMAVPRVGGINPSRLTCWNEPDSDGLCHDGALVSNDVHVLATVINKRHPR